MDILCGIVFYRTEEYIRIAGSCQGWYYIVRIPAHHFPLGIMYVTRIEINGFKSFAEQTIIQFPKPTTDGRQGITGIVGPNGSGKSNVADAIRWVLGEQSMKNLRGKKSEDIIFAGGDGKGKMSLASVTIVFDNSDKRADVPYEELSISRRLYRSGESEYVLNGNKVRLIDLQLLLARAQFGQGSYSVIGQGTIDRLLLQSAAERKEFFDEAVGIKEFQIKRHHASLKLARTEENMTQAEAVMVEIEPRLKSLKRQVTKLEQRQEVEQSLRELQEAYYGSLYVSLQHEIEKIEAELKKIETAYQTGLHELQNVQTELARLAQEKSRNEIFAELQKELAEAQQRKNQLEKDRAIATAKLETEYGKAGKQNLAWIESKLLELHQADELISSEKIETEKKLAELQRAAAERMQEAEELQRERIRLQQENARLENSMRELVRDRDSLPLEGLRAVGAIVGEPSGVFGGKVYGILAELAQVEDTYRVALEVAASAHLASIVVEDDRVAEECIKFLKQHHLGFATFLPLNTIKPRYLPNDIESLAHRRGVYGLASELVSHDSLFDHIFSYVFGSTLIVDDIEIARQIGIGKVRMVTLGGDVMETSGSMKGGYRHARKHGLTFAAKATQLAIPSIDDVGHESEKIRAKLAELESAIDTSRAEASHLRADAEIAAHSLRALEERGREHAAQISRLSQDQKINSMSKDEYSEMVKSFSLERDAIASDIEKISETIGKIQTRIEKFNREEEEKQKRVFALQDEMQQKQQMLNGIADQRHLLEVERTRQITHREGLDEEIYSEMKTSFSVIAGKGVPKLAFSIDDAKIEIEKRKYTLSLIGGIDTEVLTEYQETNTRYEELKTQLHDLKEAAEDLYAMIEELDTLMEKKHSQSFKKIKKEFSRYFSILFEGGKAELTEVYGKVEEASEDESLLNSPVADDLLETEEKPKKDAKKELLAGIEVVACPPGKKITNLAALSGGERTLTSIALLCAILHTNPSPFVLLDEVEAALDEANTLRFTKILTELAYQSQFIIITHNRVTMHASDVLYGVTMGGGGASKLVSVKVAESPIS